MVPPLSAFLMIREGSSRILFRAESSPGERLLAEMAFWRRELASVRILSQRSSVGWEMDSRAGNLVEGPQRNLRDKGTGRWGLLRKKSAHWSRRANSSVSDCNRGRKSLFLVGTKFKPLFRSEKVGGSGLKVGCRIRMLLLSPIGLSGQQIFAAAGV